jgi:malonyl-CoA O-methyltransferase
MKNKKHIAEHFSRAANTYDQAALVQSYSNNKLSDLLDQYTSLDNNDHWIDLGCGTGDSSHSLMNRGVTNITGVDLSTKMIKKYQQKMNVLKPCGTVIEGIVADAEYLPFTSQSCSGIMSNLMVQWCENLDLLWQELHRVLIDDKPLIFSTLGPKTMHELKSVWRSIDDYTHVNQFISFEYLLESLLPYFDIVEYHHDVYIQYFDNTTDLLRNLKEIGATNINKGRPLGLGGRTKLREFNARYQNLRTPSGLPNSYEFAWIMAKKKAI